MGNQAGRTEEQESGVSTTKKSGIPAPRDSTSTISRDRLSLRDQLRTSVPKKLVPSASTSSLATLAKRGTTKPRQEADGADRALLECQVKELLAEAKSKEFEISKLRMELQRCRGKATPPEAGSPKGELEMAPDPQALVGELKEKNGRFQRELAALRDENQSLKQKLISLESHGNTSPTTPSINGVHPDNNVGRNKMSSSSSSDVTKGSPSPSPDSSEFEKIPSRSNSVGSGAGNAAHDELSVERLSKKIQRMEESHHSTAEELQATLQELADQQQVVQELTAENERLAEEKSLFQTSMQQQRERIELLAQKNEGLLRRLHDQEAEEARSARTADLEQRCAELVESSRFEREKLVDIQQQLTGSLRALEQEQQEVQGEVHALREDRDQLRAQVEKQKDATAEASKAAEEQRAAVEALQMEAGRLKAQVEMEKQKVVELETVRRASNSDELRELLKAAHSERDRLEVSCSELRQEVQQAHSETERSQGLLLKAQEELRQLQEGSERRQQELSGSVSALEQQRLQADVQVRDLKETVFELEDQVEQHRAVHLHTKQTVLDLENQLRRLEEQKGEQEKQLKVLSKQMKDDAEEWRHFQADLQTAVVVANDLKVEAQQELRMLRRRLQEEQERSSRLVAELQQLQGHSDERPDADGGPHFTHNAPGGEAAANVKSLIESLDAPVQKMCPPASPVQMSSTRSPLSGIPVRTAPAAAVSPMQRLSSIKPLVNPLERRINVADFSYPAEDLKPPSLMRKSPSLESVIKSPAVLRSRNAFNCNRHNSKLSVERKDPLAALAREYGGSKRNALLKWCQKKTEGYPNIDVTNFSTSWSDGLAFCALLHTYLPAHIPYQELISQDKNRNLTLAFQAAESVGIKPSLDIVQLMHTDRPDWQSVMQYVAQIYKYFET
ncbi:cytospin-B isoform X2 [Denticeps clupeoides]|uniref:cytospin-B isoform X2 n=1 Tax=Denticeps clupeoides TaxID=299321 RepID=UPI0010A4F22B|nr:cytospin-B isoform X2 [Denticeps clupeoides]